MSFDLDNDLSELFSAWKECCNVTIQFSFVPGAPIDKNRKYTTSELYEALRVSYEVSVIRDGVTVLENVSYHVGIGHFYNTQAGTGTSIYDVEQMERYVVDGRDVLNTRRLEYLEIDFMNSILMDASAIDEEFEDWAPNYGYDTDSIKAKEIYDTCINYGLKIRRHFF